MIPESLIREALENCDSFMHYEGKTLLKFDRLLLKADTTTPQTDSPPNLFKTRSHKDVPIIMELYFEDKLVDTRSIASLVNFSSGDELIIDDMNGLMEIEFNGI